jgi:hypothetical protein
MRQIVRVPFLATAPLSVIQCFVRRGNGIGVLRMAVEHWFFVCDYQARNPVNAGL